MVPNSSAPHIRSKPLGLALVAVALFPGCLADTAGPPSGENQSVVVSETGLRVWLDAVPGAGYGHPSTITPGMLRPLLEDIWFEETGPSRSGRRRVFDAYEVGRLEDGLAAALVRANSDERIGFRIESEKGKDPGPAERLTSGFLFVRGSRMHFIFGNVNAPTQGARAAVFDGDPMRSPPASGWRIIPQGKQTLGPGGSVFDTQPHWLVIEIGQLQP
ncbi:MAG: hypothetical protein HY720_12680 [Planctomycetes bacterium]|nr:hypothetical protein [Planctomycetota bacterium]